MANPVGIIKRGDLPFADPAVIVRRKDWNPRFDFGDMKELEQSIEVNGFRKEKPLLVRRNDEGGIEIVDGDRRFTAVQALIKRGIAFPDGVPVIFEDRAATDEQALIHALTANNGKNLLPLEEAAAYKRLLDGGMKVKEIAKHVGRSEGHVKWTRELLEADDSVKDAVKDKKISGVMGKSIAQKAKGDKDKQKELVEKATKGGKAGKKLVKEEVAKIKRRPTNKSTQEVIVPKLLTESQLRTRESVLIKHVTDGLAALGVTEAQARKHFSEYDIGAAAFHFGVLIGLRAALGMDPKITL